MCDMEHNEIALVQLLSDGHKEECTKKYSATSTWAYDQKTEKGANELTSNKRSHIQPEVANLFRSF